MPSLEDAQRCPCDDDLPDDCPIHFPTDRTPEEMNRIAAEIHKRCDELALERERPTPGTTLFSISRWIGERAPGEAQVIATLRIPLGFDAEAAWETWNAEEGKRDFPRWLVEEFENVELVTMPGMVIPVKGEGR